ncbi:MAG: AMP-binding protein [Corynebacterium sp.]|nr:AMP-binding protein [Corynebacterium sp.]
MLGAVAEGDVIGEDGVAGVSHGTTIPHRWRPLRGTGAACPHPDRWWELVECHDLSSLRLLGSVGEPINPEAWEWFYEVIGAGKAPIMDTWWQTETGMFQIAGVPAMPPSAMRAGISGSSDVPTM